MGRLRKATAVAAVLAVGFALAGCGGGEDRPGNDSISGTGSVSGTGESGKATFSEGDADTVVHLKLSEFKIDADMTSAKGPHVFLDIANDGSLEHEVVVKSADGKVLTEKENIAAGTSATLAVDAEKGTYTLLCELVTGGKTHDSLGMKTTLKVT